MDRFSTRHFIFLIQAAAIVSLKTYPTTFIRNGGRDSWIALIISSVLIAAFFLYIVGICKKNNCYDMVKIYQVALGKTFGNILLFLYIAVLLLTLVESSSAEADSMHTNMLLETPNWYLLLFFIFPIIFVVRKDLVAVVTVTMIGIILIMLAGINLAILTAKYKDFHLLFPVFQKGITSGFLICIAKTLGLYGCVSITLPYLSKLGETKKIIKNSIIGLIILIQMQIVSATGIIATFGAERANPMSYPKLLQTQLVSYSRFLEFGELYVMLQILGGWMLKYSISFYAILIVLRGLKLPRNKLIIVTYGMSVLVFGCAFFVTDNLFRLFDFFNYYIYAALVGFVIVPLFVFTLFNIRNKKNS